MTLPHTQYATGHDVREACRHRGFDGPTSGLAPGFAQANLVILPREWAFDFLVFCVRNPKPCPLLDVTEPGAASSPLLAPECDLRTDLPRYRVWEDGQLVDEPTEVNSLWRADFVSFLIGCSFTFETALLQAGVRVRHIERGVNVPMYRTSTLCHPSGPFHSPMVVSMRPLPPADVVRAVQITSRYPGVHGAPVHIGDPSEIGIADLDAPDFGDPVPLLEGEIPVFWACGVTPQLALMQARPPIAITHSPGCMFVSDLSDQALMTG